jgi:hypothetical protein
MLSGKFVLRLDPQLHKSLKAEAAKSGESLNSLCLRKISLAATPSRFSEIVGKVISHFNPLGVVLFGSVARGEERAGSDIDLLIVLDATKPVQRSLYSQWDEFINPSETFSPQFVHLPKAGMDVGSIWLETAIDGEILCDPKEVLKKEYIRIRSLIAAGAYLRKSSHGQSYWVRQVSDAK